MRLTAKTGIFYIMMVLQLFNGVVAEGLFWLCLGLIFIIDYKNVSTILSLKTRRILLLFLAAFAFLFVIQVVISKDINYIRLFGLTKNICAPALLLLVFANMAKDEDLVIPLLIVILFFNCVFIYQRFAVGIDYDNEIIGSYNAISACDVIAMPCVLYFVYNSRYRKLAFFQTLVGLYVISSVVLIIISESGTAMLILAGQLLFGILLMCRINFLRSTAIRKVAGFMVVAMAAIVLFIAAGIIATKGTELATRTALWKYAFNYISEKDMVFRLFGTGDDIIRTASKQLEPHNMIMEILLIYGAVGLVSFLLFFIKGIKQVFKNRGQASTAVIISVVSYLGVCFMHPFFTGVLVFQILCLLMIYSAWFNKSRQEKVVLLENKEVQYAI